MDDRALLESAAKAAGINAQFDCQDRGMMILSAGGIDTDSWNPLNDDGCALRLALFLGISIDFDNAGYVKVGNVSYASSEAEVVRRAIVETAASMSPNA